MIFWSIKIMLLSLVLILLVHHLYLYFKNTLTIPKTKDLVNKPKETYNEIYDIIKKSPNTSSKNEHAIQANNTNSNTNNSSNTATSKPSNDSMKKELRTFLDELEKNNKQPRQKNSTMKNSKSVSFDNSFGSSPLLSANEGATGMGSYAPF